MIHTFMNAASTPNIDYMLKFLFLYFLFYPPHHPQLIENLQEDSKFMPR